LLILNSPHNPLGKVWSEDELRAIASILSRHPRVLVMTDEVYEFITFDGVPHTRMATLPGMWDRTITVSSAGKTFSCTGWKIGWTIAPPNLSQAIFLAHQWIPFCVSTPLQEAVSVAISTAAAGDYFQSLRIDMERKRDLLVRSLKQAGMTPFVPQGGYFVVADTSSIPVPKNFLENETRRDFAFARWLTTAVGVTPIPVSAFYSTPHQSLAANYARFAFCKRDNVLQQAAERLARLPSVVKA